MTPHELAALMRANPDLAAATCDGGTMTTQLRLLDLFSGAGGAAEGYRRAGFTDITGVDIAPQPRYPFRFVQADALDYLRGLINSGEVAGFDLIHASPPCQAYSKAQHIRDNGHEHPDLVAGTRRLLRRAGVPYVIENVPGAPLENGVVLCGTLFDLRVYRHRLFESSALFLAPRCAHPPYLRDGYVCVYGNVVRGRQTGTRGNKYRRYTTAYARRAMGIDWMTRDELAQAIPPAYTEYIGREMIRQLEAQR